MGTSKFPVWWEMDEKGKIPNYMSSFTIYNSYKDSRAVNMKCSNSFPPNVSANFYVRGCRYFLSSYFYFFPSRLVSFLIAYTKSAKRNITFFLLLKTDSNRFYVCAASVTNKQAAVTLAWLSLGDCVISREPLLVMVANICTWWSGNLEMAIQKYNKANYNGPLIRKEYYFFVFMWNLQPFVWN